MVKMFSPPANPHLSQDTFSVVLIRFPTGIFQTQKLNVVTTNFQDFADLSTMAVSIVLIPGRAKLLYPSKMAQKPVFLGF